MAQYDFGNLSSPLPGSTLVDDHLEPWRNALHSNHKGPSRPSYAVQGMTWIKDGITPLEVYYFDGSDDILTGYINETTNTYTAANSQIVKGATGDTTPGTLNDKILAGRETTKTVTDPTGNTTITFDVRANNIADSAPSSGTVTSSIADGIMRKITPTGNFTMAFTFDSGKVQALQIRCVNFGAYTVTWPAGIKWPGGEVPDFTAAGEDHLMVWQDNDNNVYAALIGQDMKTA